MMITGIIIIIITTLIIILMVVRLTIIITMEGITEVLDIMDRMVERAGRQHITPRRVLMREALIDTARAEAPMQHRHIILTLIDMLPEQGQKRPMVHGAGQSLLMEMTGHVLVTVPIGKNFPGRTIPSRLKAGFQGIEEHGFIHVVSIPLPLPAQAFTAQPDNLKEPIFHWAALYAGARTLPADF